MILPGRLRHRCKLVQPTDTLDERADDDITYDDTDAPIVYAGIETLQGRELLFAQQIRADLQYKITVLYRSDYSHRSILTWDDGVKTHTFHLGPPLNDDMMNRELVFYAYEIK